MQNKPKIGITMGDPNGIGPEVAIKAISDPSIAELCDFILIGSEDVLKRPIRNLAVIIL